MVLNIPTTLFEEQVVKTPDAVAIHEGQVEITYSALNIGSNRLAYVLKHIGCGPGRVVATFMLSGIGHITGLLAIFKAGSLYLPLDVASPGVRNRQILGFCDPHVMITSAAYAEEAKALITAATPLVRYLLIVSPDATTQLVDCARGGNVQEVDLPDTADRNAELSYTAKDSNYIFFTSGSTGEPKGIVGSHEALAHFIRWEIQEFRVNGNDRVSQLISLTFDASLRDIFVPLCSGATLCIPEAAVRTSMPTLLQWLADYGITLVHSVPSIFRLMIKELQRSSIKPRLALKRILLAGEPLYRRDVEQWRQAAGQQAELVNLYGTTETTLIKTFYRIGDLDQQNIQHLIPAGKPIPNTVVAIINQAGEICRIGEVGEVYIKTPYWSKGYYKNEALTEAIFIQNPLVKDRKDIVYKTGDLGRYLQDRSIEILGRSDAQVKINGVRVELPEVERHLATITGIGQVVAMAHEDNGHNKILVAYYTGEPMEAEVIRERLAGVLVAAAIPSHYIHLAQFPLNTNGKIDRSGLPQPEQLPVSGEVYEQPTNAVERKLEEIWKDILGMTQVSTSASFFGVGGSSIKAIQVISRIYKEFEVLIPIADFFTNATIGKLSKRIQASSSRLYLSMPELPQQEYYDVSHSQQRIWIINQFPDAKHAYTIHLRFVLEGDLDVTAFETAFRIVVARHEMLRTSFHLIDGVVKQKVHDFDETTVTVDYLDFSGHSDKDTAINAVLQQQTNCTFNLDEVPLFDIKLIRTDRSHLFLFSLHHIIGDDWSMGVLVREISTLYNGLIAGETPVLAPLSIQYKEYANWMNTVVMNESLDHKSYWTGLFQGTLPVLSLPLDFARPKVKGYDGGCVSFSLPASVTDRLRTISTDGNASLFMTLLACVNVLLNKLTGDRDIVVGTTVAGRESSELEGQVGFYVNTLALRTKLESGETFLSFLDKVRANVLEAYAHQIYPFDKLVTDLGLKRDAGTTPLFNVLVELLNAEGAGPVIYQLDGIRIEPLEHERLTTQYDLSFRMQEADEGMQIFLEYNRALFKKETVEAIGDGFQLLVTRVTEDVDTEIDALDIYMRRASIGNVAVTDSFNLEF